MGVTAPDYLSVGSRGRFSYVTLAVPTAPTITAADDETGTSVTVTIDGPALATNYVLYRRTDATSWSAGGNRSGDGDVTVGSLTDGQSYYFYAYASVAGVTSAPSNLAIVRVTSGADATTATLEDNYWHDKKELFKRTQHADTWIRYFRVPLVDFDALRPAVASTFSTDGFQIVGLVTKILLPQTAENCEMAVTYVIISNSGWTNGYAETRRRKHDMNLRTIWTVYGIAMAVDSEGIPDVGDRLDGATGFLDPICTDVKLDEKIYPGLYVVTSTWVKVKEHV